MFGPLRPVPESPARSDDLLTHVAEATRENKILLNRMEHVRYVKDDPDHPSSSDTDPDDPNDWSEGQTNPQDSDAVSLNSIRVRSDHVRSGLLRHSEPDKFSEPMSRIAYGDKGKWTHHTYTSSVYSECHNGTPDESEDANQIQYDAELALEMQREEDTRELREAQAKIKKLEERIKKSEARAARSTSVPSRARSSRLINAVNS